MHFQRLALVLLAVAVTLVLYSGGRRSGYATVPVPAAVAVSNGTAAFVQITGDVVQPGAYTLSAKEMTIDVISLAKPLCAFSRQTAQQQLPHDLPNGIAITVVCNDNNTGMLLSTTPIKPSQCLTLGIPLELNRLSAADLELLPGIGPVTARAIYEYRQKNGDFKSIKDLSAVEGIGELTVQKLSHFVNIAK